MYESISYYVCNVKEEMEAMASQHPPPKVGDEVTLRLTKLGNKKKGFIFGNVEGLHGDVMLRRESCNAKSINWSSLGESDDVKGYLDWVDDKPRLVRPTEVVSFRERAKQTHAAVGGSTHHA